MQPPPDAESFSGTLCLNITVMAPVTSGTAWTCPTVLSQVRTAGCSGLPVCGGAPGTHVHFPTAGVVMAPRSPGVSVRTVCSTPYGPGARLRGSPMRGPPPGSVPAVHSLREDVELRGRPCASIDPTALLGGRLGPAGPFPREVAHLSYRAQLPPGLELRWALVGCL